MTSSYKINNLIRFGDDDWVVDFTSAQITI